MIRGDRKVIPENKMNTHAGHREKLKHRFLKNGLDSFEEHNALELLLFYAIPQKDTNPLAHELIRRFGSLAGVFDADIGDLCKVNGISRHSATLLKMMPALARRYYSEITSDPRNVYDSVGKIAEFFISNYIGVTVETVFAMFLDNRYGLLGFEKLHEGSVNSVNMSVRTLVEAAMRYKAAMVVLAHNHPQGIPIASTEDVATTNTISAALEIMDIKMLEHIVVSGSRYSPILVSSTGVFAQKAKERKHFYRDFDVL